MALFRTLTSHTGTADRDVFLGLGGGPDHIFTGGDGNDFMLGDALDVLVDTTASNSAARVTDLTTLNAAFAAATNIDLAAFWSTATNPTITNDSVPHMSIYGTGTSTANSEFFTVTVGAGETITLDLDFAFPDFDGQVRLFDMNSATELQFDDDGPNNDPGSIGTGNGNGGSPRDSFFSYTNNTGAAVTYLIEVEALGSGQIETSDQYILNVSVTNHATGTATLNEGNDTLNGGNGNDVLFGVGGNDTFVASDNDGNDYMDGGAGNDRANYGAVTGDLTIDLGITGAQDTGAAGFDTLLNIERVDGGSGNDTLTAAATGSDLRGFSGDDTLNGGDGNDFLYGGIGRDTINAGGGNDTIQFDRTNHFEAMEVYDGGAGTDRLVLLNNLDNTVYDFRTATTFANFEELGFAPSGGEEIIVQLTQTQWAANDFATIASGNRSAEAVIEVFADSTDALDLSGLTFSSNWDQTRDQVILQGDAQNNTLIAADVASILNGGDGDDTIIGGAGDDVLDGGAGTNDTLSYADYAPASGSIGVSVSLNSNANVVTATAGTDEISGFENITGSAFDDDLTGVIGGDNTLIGGEGDDIIQGAGGADTIDAGAGNDLIFVSALDTAEDIGSTIDGGADTDRLILFRTGDGVSETVNFRDDTILNIEIFEIQDTSDRSFIVQFDADQFNFDTVQLDAHAGQTRVIDIRLDTETTLDLSGITFTGFTEMGDGVLITGDADDETITGSSVDDTINAGDGDDVIFGTAGGDTIDGGLGTNTLSYAGSAEGVQVNLNINSFAGGDAEGDSVSNIQNLTGSDHADNLVGNATVASVLRGGSGNDLLHESGTGLVDQVYGDAGDDIIRVDASNLAAGEIYDGGADTDTFRLVFFSPGQVFDLTSVTLQNFETLQIGQSVGGGHDIILTDTQFGSFQNISFYLPDGSDTSITVNRTSSGTLNLNSIVFDANWTAGSTITVNGTASRDGLIGTVQRDILNGGGGNDAFILLSSIAGFETDTYNGGADGFNGSNGSGDAISVRGLGLGDTNSYDLRMATILDIEEIEFFSNGVSGANLTLQLAAGQIGNGGIVSDALIDGDAFGGADYSETIEIYLDHEGSLDLSDWQFFEWNEGVGTDRIVIIGNDIAETLTGTTEGDEINGNGGNDILRGGAGEDTLNGGAGEDRLEGGTFSDTLIGGTDADILVGGSGNDFLDGGTNFDTALYTGLSTGVTVDLDITIAQDTVGAGTDTLIRIENLVGSGQADTLSGNFNRNRLDGGAGDDIIDGRGGNDTLIGGAGNDELTGGTGADKLVGGTGEDELFGGDQRDRLEGGANDDRLFGGDDVDRLLGGDGDDLLVGGAGTDFLFGGAGADDFVFTGEGDSGVGPFMRDEIRDFSRLEGDRIVLQNFDADSTTAGIQLFTDAGSSFTGNAGELIIQSFVRSGVDVRIISMDTDGDAKADSQIYLISDDIQFSDISQQFGTLKTTGQSVLDEGDLTPLDAGELSAVEDDVLANTPLDDSVLAASDALISQYVTVVQSENYELAQLVVDEDLFDFI